jgi:ABC-type transport system involved in multi-copper enzyme maturation permease subunit
MVALILLFSLLHGLLNKPVNLMSAEDQRATLDIGGVAGLFSALAGALLVTSEYRFGTIRPTFLFQPRRSHVLAAKVAASLLAGLAFGVAGETLGIGIGYAILHGRGIPFVLNGGQLSLLGLGGLASVALWGTIGLAVGAILRNQVGAVIGLLTWGLVVESLLFGFVPSIGRFTPGRAQDALTGLTTKHLLGAPAGGAVLLAWAVLLALGGILLTARRDVS